MLVGSINLTGVPKAPTAASGTSTTQIATTAFVTDAITDAAGIPGGSVASIQFNSAGAFGGFGSWNGTILYIPGDLSVSGVIGPHGGTRLTSNSGAFNLGVSDWFVRTLNGTNGTLTVSNEKINQIFTIELVQDSTGSRTVSWSSFGTIEWMTPGGSPPSLPTGAGIKVTLIFKRVSAGSFMGWLTGDQSAVIDDIDVTPGGSDGQIQYNNSGSFAGSAALTTAGGSINPRRSAGAFGAGDYTAMVLGDTVTGDVSGNLISIVRGNPANAPFTGFGGYCDNTGTRSLRLVVVVGASPTQPIYGSTRVDIPNLPVRAS